MWDFFLIIILEAMIAFLSLPFFFFSETFLHGISFATCTRAYSAQDSIKHSVCDVGDDLLPVL